MGISLYIRFSLSKSAKLQIHEKEILLMLRFHWNFWGFEFPTWITVEQNGCVPMRMQWLHLKPSLRADLDYHTILSFGAFFKQYPPAKTWLKRSGPPGLVRATVLQLCDWISSRYTLIPGTLDSRGHALHTLHICCIFGNHFCIYNPCCRSLWSGSSLAPQSAEAAKWYIFYIWCLCSLPINNKR